MHDAMHTRTQTHRVHARIERAIERSLAIVAHAHAACEDESFDEVFDVTAV